jgi:hypothetical protein
MNLVLYVFFFISIVSAQMDIPQFDLDQNVSDKQRSLSSPLLSSPPLPSLASLHIEPYYVQVKEDYINCPHDGTNGKPDFKTLRLVVSSLSPLLPCSLDCRQLPCHFYHQARGEGTLRTTLFTF